MTVFGIEVIVRRNTVKRPDRGGKGMNLINMIMTKSDDNGRMLQTMDQRKKITEDQGYQLYRTMEYKTGHRDNENPGMNKMLAGMLIR